MTYRKMFDALNKIDHLTALLADARAAVGPAKEAFALLVARVEAARGDPSLVRDAGEALDQIARGKLYRLRQHRTMAEFLAQIGLSRTTAHNWRRVSRMPPEETEGLSLRQAYRRARPDPAREHRGALDAEELAEDLAALGVEDAVVTPVVRGGRIRVRVELDPHQWTRLTRAPARGRKRRRRTP